MKNKFLTTLFTSLLILNNFAFGFDLKTNSNNREIKTTLKKHNKIIASNKLNLINNFYDEEYKSADGFNLEEMKTMIENTKNSFKNIKHKTKINNICAYDNWALAQMSDTTKAKVYPNKKYKKKVGYLNGKSSFIVYLKKEDNSWKIIRDEILMEETSLKYGIANKINMDLKTPIFVEKNQDYDVSFNMEKTNDIIAIASLSREEVSYPAKETIEKFRTVGENGKLERVVKANNNGKDEYAIASVGFTKITLNEEETRARISILGMAYLMKRINMNDSLIK